MSISQERLMTVLRSPIISEKSTNIGDAHRQFVFKVLADANKNEIKNAVELMFNVKVTAVRTCKVKGKVKQRGRVVGQTKNWKKAYISLAEGHDLDFLTNE